MTGSVRGLEPGARAALLVSEVQNAWCNPAYDDSPLARQSAERDIVTRINTVAAAFRAADLPVVFCTIAARDADWTGWRVTSPLQGQLRRDGRCVTGTRHAALHDRLVVDPADIVVHRHHGLSPFTGTDLDATLRTFEIDTVVLAGVSTNIALPTGAAEAVALGYSVVLAEDASAGGTAETHRVQISMHLPLLATVSDSESVMAALPHLDAGPVTAPAR
ncbi:cysteine hydrolase family protein [Jatrophihabitans fulvus]